MIGLSIAQHPKLYTHLYILDRTSYPRYYSFTDEEAFLYYIVYNQLGEGKLRRAAITLGEALAILLIQLILLLITSMTHFITKSVVVQ